MIRKQPATDTTVSPLRALWAWVLHACAWYAVISTAVLLIYMIRDMAPSPLRLLLVLPLSLCLAGASRVRHSSLSAATRIVCHALLTLGGAYLFAYLPMQIELKPSARVTLVSVLLGVLIYVPAMAVIAVLTRHRERRKTEDKPYQPQFDKRNN